MSNSNYAAKRSAIQASFDDNCVEDIVEFSSIIKNMTFLIVMEIVKLVTFLMSFIIIILILRDTALIL